MPINYKNTKIYKILNVNMQSCEAGPAGKVSSGLVYYGTTTIKLSAKLSNFKKSYNKHLRENERIISHREKTDIRNKDIHLAYKVLKHGECMIYLVENFPCNNIEEARSRLLYHIERNICVNMQHPLQNEKMQSCDEGSAVDSALQNHKQNFDNKDDIIYECVVAAEETGNQNCDSKLTNAKIEVELDNRKRYKCHCGSILLRRSKARHERTTIHKSKC